MKIKVVFSSIVIIAAERIQPEIKTSFSELSMTMPNPNKASLKILNR